MGERAGHGFAGFPRGPDLLNRASSIVPGGGLKVVLAERDVRFFFRGQHLSFSLSAFSGRHA